ncbi:hypothetical protein JCM15548_272 [Geofilum rubicundum JCM 15548]|uniref:TIGR02757 family protein n=1 Tax=Geofilum rubicundum JCM 15548 TaxID=1236989 RepID=A0A0E9LSS5_9BACT|nr:hypothetical protein JCM15548_272 [Geofilum rubicundum JCM 15548]
MVDNRLKDLLDEKAAHYNQAWFIEKDPVSVPHMFSRKEDCEISGFLTATLAWGQRGMILKKARLLMEWMDLQPYAFVTGAGDRELQQLSQFVYRTFNGIDCQYFVSALREIYLHHGGLETVFSNAFLKGNSVFSALSAFRELFLSFRPMDRTGKHVANVMKGSSGKRLNMFLRWMVRKDGVVDLGLWPQMDAAKLMMPLDVHVGRVARNLGLLNRQQDDWKAVEELTLQLRSFRPEDPVFYDYALFGWVFLKKTCPNRDQIHQEWPTLIFNSNSLAFFRIGVP